MKRLRHQLRNARAAIMRQEDELDALRDSLYRVEHLAQLLTLAVALIFFTLVSWAFIDELESRGII